MKLLLPTLSLVLAVASLRVSAQGPSTPLGAGQIPATACDAVTDVQLVCGQEGPEDLVVLPGSQWVVASAFSGTGGINIIRVRDKTTIRAYPSPTAKKQFDAKTYAACPGPPDAASGARFTTHGLWLQAGRGAVYKLFAVGHGSRESIEVFEVDVRGDRPVMTWIGCAVAPDPIGLNSVRDGRWLYVAAWGSQSFLRLSRGRIPATRDEVPLGFRVDNIRLARDGSLLAAGQGQQSLEIVRIDPKTLAVKTLIQRPDGPSFQSGTVAVEVGDRLWVGSFRGDRIAVLPAP
jgi:hypothetical protein